MKNFALKVVIFVLCVCSIICVTVSFLKPNILSQIGESKISGAIDVPEINYYKSGWHDEWEWMEALKTFGALDIEYREEFLRGDVESVVLLFFFFDIDYADDNDFNIYIVVKLSEVDQVRMALEVDYDYEKEELIYEPIYIIQGEWDKVDDIEEYTDEKSIDEYLNRYGLTRKDVQEYQEYALYDVVVKTWAKAHHKSYFLERWKLKRCKVVDNTFRFEEE